jgi:hypothetical protein
LAPLPIPEPSLLLSTSDNQGKNPTGSSVPLHLYFLLTLHDPTHSLRFTTVTQPSPADWLDVEYERSDWVEERLVEVLRTSVEVIAQDVSTRERDEVDVALTGYTVCRDENGAQTFFNHETSFAINAATSGARK